MIEYVLIDLDGTLINFDMGEKVAFREAMLKGVGYNVTEEDTKHYSEINEIYFNEYAKGITTRKEFHYKRYKEMFEYLGVEGDILKTNDIYMESLKYQAVLYDDVLEALEYLSKKYKLYVASNGLVEVQTKRLTIANIIKYFERLYVSEEIGVNKPDVRFFEYIFNDLDDYDMSKYIIIGDRLESDILGGINAKIKTIYLNRNNKNGDVKPDYIIDSFDKINNIL